MAMKNKYAYRSRISEAKIRQLVKLFSVDLTASQIAELSGVNRNTVNRYVTAFRERIARYCEAESPVKGEVEVDESYFGARRVRGIRGRGARGKTIVFGLFKRNDNVYTEIVPDCSRATLQGIIRGRVDLESVIHSDGWRGYDGLVDLGYQKHFRVQHSHNEFSNKHSHINGIESFWSYAKTRLVRFRGLQKQTFYLHLKECEFRFKHRQEDIYLLVLKLLRENPLRACLETSAFIVTRRHVDKKRLCAAAKTREDCQTVPQRSDGQRMGACTSSPAPCFRRRSEAQNRPA